ncbi:MAG: T9SS type A sorting domain-containing protein [Bacteroidales bacterium]|nr:T9SS type A sorting domain-containing protein [Bacteroidales bacterium]
MNILVSTTPVDSGYILVIGTGDVEGYGYNRCSMILKTDNMGNVLYRNFVCDSSVDVYEGWYNQNTVLMDNSCLKYVFAKKNKCAYICDFNEELEIINTQSIYYSSDSSLVDAKTAGFYSIDEHLYIPNIIRTDTLDTELYHPILLKVDNNNNLIYNKYMYIGNANHQYTNIIKAFDGNLIAFGDMYASHLWLVSKIDTLGNMIWYRKYGRTNWHNGIYKFISSSPDSCFVMSGIYPVCYANRFEDETSNAACVRKIDDDGNLLWERIIKNYYSNYYNGPGMHPVDCAYDLYVDEDGYIYVAGQGTIYTGFTGFLTKLTSDGDIMFRRYYTPDGSKSGPTVYLNSVKPTPDGGLIMGGYTYDSYYTASVFGDYYQQPWLIKTDMDGLDGLCYTELPELTLDIFMPDTVCNLDTIGCIVNISGPSAPYTMEFSTGQIIDNIYYPDIFVPKEIGIDTVLSGELLYQYTEPVTEATIKDTAVENIIARHYNIATPTLPGEQQLAITLTDFYGNTKTIYKDIYVNSCHEVEVDEDENVVLSVYPNPASENIIVEGENIAEIQVCNLLGEVVYYNSSVVPRRDATIVISTENMPAGSYFVRVRMEDSKVVTKKIVVM